MQFDSPPTSLGIRPCPRTKDGSKCGLRKGLKRSGDYGRTCRRQADGGAGSLGRAGQISGANLWLRVGPNGSKAWFFRYTIAVRTREMGLGPWPLVPLSEARDKATAQRRLLLDGVDPIAARDAKKPARDPVTFEAAAKQYIAGHELSWKSRDHARQWRNSLDRYVLPLIGERPIDGIDTHDVLLVVERLWLDKTETATRVLDRIRLVLDWAAARKLRTGDNPARWKGHLEAALPKRSRVQRIVNHAALPYQQIAFFMRSLRQQKEQGAKAAEFLILTSSRTGEVRFATWQEIDLGGRCG